jgi:hypothetical protein
MPPKWLGMYEEFVTKNASSVGQIESALRSLSYIIPGTNMMHSPRVAIVQRSIRREDT